MNDKNNKNTMCTLTLYHFLLKQHLKQNDTNDNLKNKPCKTLFLSDPENKLEEKSPIHDITEFWKKQKPEDQIFPELQEVYPNSDFRKF